MMRPPRFLPKSIGGQLALLVGCSMLLTAIFAAAIALALRPTPTTSDASPPVRIGGFMSTIRILVVTPDPMVRAAIIESAQAAFSMLELTLVRAADLRPEPDGAGADFARFVGGDLGARHRVVAEHSDVVGNIRVAVEMPDGFYVRGEMPLGRPPSPFFGFFAGTVGFALLTLVLVSFWAARWLTAPLRTLAEAAASFELDKPHEMLVDAGPNEVRAASRALNTMRVRVSGLVAQRSRMLAAVGHDLRTPITRLRLRAEFIEDAAQRQAMLADLERMSVMVEDALTFLRTGQAPTRRNLIDLGALLQTISDDFVEMGANVSFEPPARRIVVEGDDDALYRALANPVENGIKFGTTVTVRLGATDGRVTIDIADDGPGIDPAERDEMLEPFVRGDSARPATDAGGFGLGLSITRSVVEVHGGTLVLMSGETGGLIVRITLREAAGSSSQPAPRDAISQHI